MAKDPLPGTPYTFTLHGPDGDATGGIGEFVAWVLANREATQAAVWNRLREWYQSKAAKPAPAEGA